MDLSEALGHAPGDTTMSPVSRDSILNDLSPVHNSSDSRMLTSTVSEVLNVINQNFQPINSLGLNSRNLLGKSVRSILRICLWWKGDFIKMQNNFGITSNFPAMLSANRIAEYYMCF